MQTPLVIAHRGDSSNALENSMAAFKLAIAVPADMIELDLRMSRDGALYVMHDKQTGRTANRNIDLEAARSQEIAGVQLRNGEPLPRLEDVLALLDGNIRINLEIKSSRAGGALARVLAGLPARDRIVVSSFHESEVLSVRKALPDVRCALIYDTFSARHVQQYRGKGYELISLRKNTVTEALVKACHSRGVAMYVWTVDEPEAMMRCIEWQVDGIYTNKPRLLAELIGKSQIPDTQGK